MACTLPLSIKIVKDQSERIKKEITALYDSTYKKPINVAKEYPRLYLKARKIFGSWKKALESCRIDYEEARNRKKWSREKISQEIMNLYGNCHSLRPKDLKKEGMINLFSAATYHFGSWSKAVESCRIPYPVKRK